MCLSQCISESLHTLAKAVFYGNVEANTTHHWSYPIIPLDNQMFIQLNGTER